MKDSEILVLLREVIEAENQEQEEKAAELFSWLREHKYM